jgi:hypothetical protein
VADVKTDITEIVTGLGMLSTDSFDLVPADPPLELRGVPEATWRRLRETFTAGLHVEHFSGAWANGAAFLAARDGLRGRRPIIVEWTGGHRDPADAVAPVDLRIDHVYLVSCKYLSRILVNASPASLFQHCLRGRQGVRQSDWYAEVEPVIYQELYEAARSGVEAHVDLPASVTELRAVDRAALKAVLALGWPAGCDDVYRAFSESVARASAERWRAAMTSRQEEVAMLWRLLRIGNVPYFVLGSASGQSLQLRIGTAWDWREQHDLKLFEIWAKDAGQPTVGWRAVVTDKRGRAERLVAGHVEVRWSHGRFARPPEAKVYLDTPHEDVPGYFPLV